MSFCLCRACEGKFVKEFTAFPSTKEAMVSPIVYECIKKTFERDFHVILLADTVGLSLGFPSLNNFSSKIMEQIDLQFLKAIEIMSWRFFSELAEVSSSSV